MLYIPYLFTNRKGVYTVKRTKKIKLDPGLLKAIEASGTRYRLAKNIGISPTSVLKWHEVPIKRVIAVEQATGVDRADLRPDFFHRTTPA